MTNQLGSGHGVSPHLHSRKIDVKCYMGRKNECHGTYKLYALMKKPLNWVGAISDR
jgi:hypothetical protein